VVAKALGRAKLRLFRSRRRHRLGWSLALPAYDTTNETRRGELYAIELVEIGLFGAGPDDFAKSLRNKIMLHYAVIFLIIAIVAGLFGFTGIAGTSAWIAHLLFVLFLILFIISLIFRGRPSV
jgi:uncharacterized membrane protein YtjA (UPF0391 family)